MHGLGGVLRDDFLQKGTFMFLAASATGVINILFRALMGRMLTVEEFGTFNAIFALAFYLSFILTRTIRTSTTDLISNRIGRGRTPLSPGELNRALRNMAIIGTLFTIGFVLLAWPIKGFLKLDSTWVVMSAVPFLVISWVLPVNLGLFQGSQRFLLLATSNLAQASLKMVFGALFVLAGLGAVGAMMGVGMGALAAFCVSLAFVLVFYKGLLVAKGDPQGEGSETGDKDGRTDGDGTISLGELLSVSGHVLIAILCLAILTNIDVVLVKHFFSSEETGLYSAALVFGRLIYFLPVGFITVMYPRMVRSHAEGSSNYGILAKSIIFISVPVLVFTVLLSLFPSASLRLLLGAKYLGAEDLVVLYSALMFIFSLVSILVYYFLAERRYAPIYAFAAISVLQIAAAWFHHPDLSTVIWIFIVANLAFLLIGTFVVVARLLSRDERGGPGD